MRTLKERRKAAAFRTTTPTMTDQAGAANTDLNIIVTQFLKTGQSPSKGTPIYGDFTEFPRDLKTAIERAASVNRLRKGLPTQLRELPIEQLLGLTPEKIREILTPPKEEGEQSSKPKSEDNT